MPGKDATFSREEGGAPQVDLRAVVERKMQKIIEEPREELAEPLFWWDIFAIGPFQAGALTVPPGDLVDHPLLPHRIIQVGEEASIFTIVLFNPNFPDPSLSACDIITGFNAKVELNYFTSNTQTMQPVRDLSASRCVRTSRNVCFYVDEFKFTPREAACLYETNICARICTCDNRALAVQPFGGFVRWILNLDSDWIFGAPLFEFDRPIRYMVSEFDSECVAC